MTETAPIFAPPLFAPSRQPLTIAVLVLPHCSILEVACVLDPLREHHGGPFSPNSVFRSQALERELKRLARSHLRRENPGHTLSATALVHEAWFRLAEQDRTAWQNRGHFLAMASTMMRRVRGSSPGRPQTSCQA